MNGTLFVHSLAFSPDGKTLASGNNDDSVRLWEVATGQERYRFLGHRGGGFIRVAFSRHGKMLASASPDTTALVWDLPGVARETASSSTPLSDKDLQNLWADLAQDDATKAYRAIWTLVLDPDRSVPFLRGQLRPVPEADLKAAARLIDDLNHDQVAVREKAAHQLSELAERAVAELRKSLERSPSLEARSRIERLLERAEAFVPSRGHLRVLRALEVLENIGTKQAHDIMVTLSKGAPEARLTQEALASLERLGQMIK
jgi:hypothetical protein